jgi:mannobiose 2-epimerase
MIIEMTATDTIHILPAYRQEVSIELLSILEFWEQHMPDKKNGGFYGSIGNDNLPDMTAPKGIVLNSRILWSFSAASQFDKTNEWIKTATTAYKYIVDHFIDRKYGGVYWSVNDQGTPIDARKQIYGLAFCIYGLTEYYKATGENMAMHLAKDLYEKIEQHSRDKKNGGYLEAFTQGWKLKDDLRLSEKDDNEKKTMNTHLHIIEAYANLYKIWADAGLRDNIKHLLDVFDKYFLGDSSHARLFMDENWKVKSSLVSYGHDIEASWLLLQCAETIGEAAYIDKFSIHAIQLAEATIGGLDNDGGLWYEYDPSKNILTQEKHSWPQAEAMVGFFNAFQLTGDERYLHHSAKSWEFIKTYIRDNTNGEWFWGIKSDYTIMQKEKAGFWKCPYHSTRACMEIAKRISGLK